MDVDDGPTRSIYHPIQLHHWTVIDPYHKEKFNEIYEAFFCQRISDSFSEKPRQAKLITNL
jgi:hypothetical protein